MDMLFHVLWIVTFILHMLFVNAALGGTLLAALAEVPGLKVRNAAALFTDVNAWAIPLAIAFGFPPLLFMQLLHGRLFYSAAPHVAAGWLAMLVLLAMAYGGQVAGRARLRGGRNAFALLSIAALLFVAVAAVQVAVHLLQVQPALWEAASRNGWIVLGDRTFVPRFLHFVLAGVSLAGALAMRQGIKRAEGGDRTEAAALARFGSRVALYATIAQLLAGFWLVSALPRAVLIGLMRGGGATMVPLTLGILLGLVLLILLAQLSDPLSTPRKARHVTEMLLGAIILMVVTRHQVRDLYLATWEGNSLPAVSPQWGVFLVLLLAFLACTGVILLAGIKARKDRPKDSGERA